MKCKGAAGPDNIPPSFLKLLGRLASRNYYIYSTHPFLLLIVHMSGGLVLLFHYWKLGNLLVKLHLFTSSVSHHVLSNFWNAALLIIFTTSTKPKIFSANSKQNFGKVWAVKIRLLRQVEAIADDFHQHMMQRSILTLLDFCKAYNTGWRETLALHTLDAGISSTFTRCIWSFSKDCRTRVQLCNVCSSSRPFTLGLLQGWVLAPLLFLFYINDLTSLLNGNAVIALFADDISILTTACKKEYAKVATSI